MRRDYTITKDLLHITLHIGHPFHLLRSGQLLVARLAATLGLNLHHCWCWL